MMNKRTILGAALSACLGFGASINAETLKINFGDAVADAGWNNASASVSIALFDDAGATTDSTVLVTSPFNSTNRSGPTAAVGDFPGTVTATSFFGNSSEFGGGTYPNPAFEVTGLDSSASYDLTIFASRMSASDIRTATYTATGANTVVGELDAANNMENTLTISGVMPTTEGKITVTLATAASSTSSSGFIYINGLILSSDGGATGETWAGFPLVDNIAQTGNWLGQVYVYPDNNWIYLYSLNTYVYLPEPAAGASGSWGYIKAQP
jgi:hypothetical protein